MTLPQELHVVPHTHWDREWYEPFETHRFRLLGVLDDVLELLGENPGFRHFNCDGQTAVVEDYLAAHPEREPEIARLVTEGRLSAGPWRILMDEFLCSPETILRNLQQGHALAEARLGKRMRVGYIPDSFGHISQMPQILRLAGISDACVWRGVPSAIDRTVFWWEAPDGSRVRTLSMPSGYSHAGMLPESVEDLMVRAKEIIAALAPFEPGRVMLAMNGNDHAACQPHLANLFHQANASQDEIKFRIGSLEEYLSALPPDEELPSWRGELRSSARGNLLMGVVSVRVPLKQAEWRASTELERYAEPLAVLSGTNRRRLLEIAWHEMVASSAHDSITGCGIDEVAADVAVRYTRAARIAELAAADGLERLAGRVDARDGVLVFNPSPFPRQGVVHVALADPSAAGLKAPDGSTHLFQLLDLEQETLTTSDFTAPELREALPELVGILKARAAFANKWFPNAASVDAGSITTLTIVVGTERKGVLDPERFAGAVESAIADHPEGQFKFRLVSEAATRALAWVPNVGGVGWSVLQPADGPALEPATTVRAEGAVLDNGLVRAEVTDEGTVRLSDLATATTFEGLFAFEDGADAGDEYNYSPPERDRVIRAPDGPVTVEVVEKGPLRAAVRVAFQLRVPSGLDESRLRRTRRSVAMPVQLDLAFHAGEPFLRASISVDNRATDHRLRVIFPLPFDAERSHADAAFDVVERGLEAEGAAFEHGLPTFPSRRWVDASDGHTGLAVFHRGTPEYELTAGGSTLAITLLRGVGWLSRNDLRYRTGGAGPSLPTPGAQVLGTHRFDLAVYPHAGDWRNGNVPQVMEEFAYGLRATPLRATSTGEFAAEGSALTIEPSEVQLSAFLMHDDGLTVRVWNNAPTATEALLHAGSCLGITHAERTDLFGDQPVTLEWKDGAVRLPLVPWEIANVRLSCGSSSDSGSRPTRGSSSDSGSRSK